MGCVLASALPCESPKVVTRWTVQRCEGPLPPSKEGGPTTT